jgi:hypothetical protein
MAAGLAPSDLALFGGPEWAKAAVAAFSAMFAQGLEGYTEPCRTAKLTSVTALGTPAARPAPVGTRAQ